MDRMAYADATTLSDRDLWALRHLGPVPPEMQPAMSAAIRGMQRRELQARSDMKAAATAFRIAWFGE